MVNYLLEVGTENLPVDFQNSAQSQVIEVLSVKLKEERLTFSSIVTYATPRRLAIIVEDLSERQTDQVKVVKGPPASTAFKDGNPTPAAEGFAKKNGISVKDLKVESFDNVDYVIAKIEEIGKPCGEILQSILPDIILNLKGSHFMRWEDLDVRFSRPIRWLTSVMDNQTLPIKIANIESTNCSTGHRFLHPQPVKIDNPGSYKDALRQAFVLVDPEERINKITQQLEAIASSKGGIIQPNDKLLRTVNNLVEWPVSALGEFDEEYLFLPEEVITTVMAVHQKYFPIYDIERKALMNYFICVSNREGSNFENIIKGNQRVLRARLEDAAFYYNEDRKHSLASRVEGLKGVTFQKGLGTMYQKMQRIKALSSEIANQLNYSDQEKQYALKAAELCKADLTTFMVREFTELEGIIGSIYSYKDEEPRQVTIAIAEHYLPRSSEDVLPRTNAGMVISIADKIDTIVSVFAIGKSPTGSADPLGLRRAALGILLIVLKNSLNINLSQLIENAYDLLGDIKKEEKGKVINQVKDFIIQRIRIYLNEKSYRYDVIEAVLTAKDPLNDLVDTYKRTIIVDNLINGEDYTPFHESSNRLIRILKGIDLEFRIDPNLLVHESEKRLYDEVNKISLSQVNYETLVERLKDLTPIVEKFFDDVLVMDNNSDIKTNRLSLVNETSEKYKTLADFSKIVN